MKLTKKNTENEIPEKGNKYIKNPDGTDTNYVIRHSGPNRRQRRVHGATKGRNNANKGQS